MVTIREAAELAGCSSKTIRNKIKAGDLRAVKKEGRHGPEYSIPEAELARLQGMLGMSLGHGNSKAKERVEEPSPSRVTDSGQDLSSVVLKLSDELRKQAEELGQLRAISQRSSEIEENERALRSERDRLASELAIANAKLSVLETRPQRRRWFGTRSSMVER
jgi:excisionase family DNA binding protein